MRTSLIWSILIITSGTLAQEPASRAELLRDPWGVPHVFAQTDTDAFYALGWVQARDRGFQMQYRLRLVQGRLAETVGNVRHTRRRDDAVLHDTKMRSFGWWHRAQQAAERLPEELRGLLQAYSDGVNASFAAQGEDQHPLFAQLDLTPEPWSPAACIATWWYLGQFFATDGTRDAIARRGQRGRRQQQMEEMRRAAGLEALGPDDDSAVVQEHHVSDGWRARVRQFLKEHGFPEDARGEADGEGRKFSHAWAVGRGRSKTGSALLVSDPQTQVTHPALFHEYHFKGASFDARGIGVPGCPMLLIGFTPRVAWGVTALGADQADLFELETRGENPGEYRWNGEWRAFTWRDEVIEVRGEDARKIRVRESHIGPDVRRFSYPARGDGVLVSRRVPLATAEARTLVAGLAMLRAQDGGGFRTAIADWRFPSCNLIYGDASGEIGYWTQAAIPLRSPKVAGAGRYAMKANSDEQLWRTFVPHSLLPHVVDPREGVLFSGNHRPVASFYPISLGAMTGSGGDGVRSWRLRELLSGEGKLDLDDMLRMQSDCTSPVRREIVRLGLHLRDVQKLPLSPESQQALRVLEPWLKGGARSDLRVPGAAIAKEIPMLFRFVQTELTFRYGGGLSGLTRWLKDTKSQLDGGNARFGERERAYVDRVLQQAWRSAEQKYGPVMATPATRLIAGGPRPFLRSLDGFPSPAPEDRLPARNLFCRDGLTVLSQAAQSYTQVVDLSDVDRSLSILPPQNIERRMPKGTPEAAAAERSAELWERGQLHPAPLSRAVVEKSGARREALR